MEYRKKMDHYRKSEKQAVLREKEELVSRLKVHNEKNKEIKQVSLQDTTQYKELYKKAKKEKDKFQKENISFKSKNIELNTHLLHEKAENQRLRKLLFEAEQLKTEQIDKVDILNKQLNIEKDNNLRLQLEKEQLLIEKETLSKSLAKVHAKLVNEKQHNKRLREENVQKAYTKQLKETLAKQNEELFNYKSINNNQKKEISELKKDIQRYKKFDPEFLLEQLYALLTHENFKSYKKTGILNRKYLLTKKNHYRLNNGAGEKVKELYGIYVEVEEPGQSFVKDTNGTRYGISSTFNGFLKNGDPVACELLENGTVHIYWRYDAEEIMKEDKNLSSIAVKVKDSQAVASGVYENFKSALKVGIVTSQSGNKYVERLSKHGMSAIWIDAYEKSPVHVKVLMDGCDIVLLCIDSMPHFVLDLITTETKERYHILSQHNEEVVVNRVRLALKDN